MRVSLKWLEELVEVRDPAALPDALTFAGLEVERVEQLGAGIEAIVVARILSSQPHPKADRLSVTEVDAGERRLQIVCGAKNYQVGDLVPLAPPGTVLPGGRRIEATELRGVQSLGMLCSAEELGLPQGEAAAGLLILPQGLPGQRLCDALPLVDTVFELNVTPNRADCLSHLGVAREVAALDRRRAAAPIARPTAAPTSTDRSAALVAPRIEDPDRCLRLLGQPLAAEGLHAPSPFVMQYRLQACGIRPIGLAVDVTNTVMLELGQPLHAYDLDKLRQGLVVRRARPGERLVTLDGIERQLDRRRPPDLRWRGRHRTRGRDGWPGHRDHGADAPALSRGRLLRARRNSAHRQAPRTAERGGAPLRARRGSNLPERALARAVALLSAVVPTVDVGEVQRAEGKLPPRRPVKLRLARSGELLGWPLEDAEVVGRLGSVGVRPVGPIGLETLFEVPSHRGDLTEAVDLIAEVGRLAGYQAIPARAPRLETIAAPDRAARSPAGTASPRR